jgi:hypothetical protein
MNVMLLAAFGLVALGAVIRLVLFLTAHKDRSGMESV